MKIDYMNISVIHQRIYPEQRYTAANSIGNADYIRNYIRFMLVAVRFDQPHWSLRFKPIVLQHI